MNEGGDAVTPPEAGLDGAGKTEGDRLPLRPVTLPPPAPRHRPPLTLTGCWQNGDSRVRLTVATLEQMAGACGPDNVADVVLLHWELMLCANALRRLVGPR